MRIAELADRAGVKVSTVRFYERSGVIAAPPRSMGGYRDYDEDAVLRVRYLRRGQELGFRLAELQAFASWSSDADRDAVMHDDVAAAARRKLEEIDAKIEDLSRTRAAIEGLLDEPCADRRAACPIVAALAGGATRRSQGAR